MVIWLIGISGSGKTYIGSRLYNEAKNKIKNLIFLDGDQIREVVNENDLASSYTMDKRKSNLWRIAKLCKLLNKQNINIICCVQALFPEVLEWNRRNFSDYFEIFISTRLDIIKKRDYKGLHKLYMNGKVKNVVGCDIEFVPPNNPDLIIDNNDISECINKKVKMILNNTLFKD